MTKTLFTFSVACLAGIASHAQVVITPKAGLNVSTMSSNEDDTKFKTGLAAGAAFELPLGDALSLQPELLFSQKGAANEDDGVKTTFGLNYLEVPVLLKYRFGEADELHFFGYAGPYVGFGLGGNYKFSSGSLSVEGKIKFGEEPDNYNGDDLYLGGPDDVNRMDAGLNIGAGVGLPVGPGAVTLEARYGYGFLNLNKPVQGQPAGDAKSQHRVFGIFLGFSLPLGN